MASIEASGVHNGVTLMIDGKLYVVLWFMNVKPGKGAAILKTRLKDLRTGNIVERNFSTNERFELANIQRKVVQYSYESGGTYYFMDQETFDTYELSAEIIGDQKYYLLDGMELKLSFYGDEVLDVVLPDKVDLVVVETTPAVPGASSTSTKDAVTNTGLRLRVPQFIKQDETITVSTIDGSYCGRA